MKIGQVLLIVAVVGTGVGRPFLAPELTRADYPVD